MREERVGTVLFEHRDGVLLVDHNTIKKCTTHLQRKTF